MMGKNSEHKWTLDGDLKAFSVAWSKDLFHEIYMFPLLMGQSRQKQKHHINKQWPERKILEPRFKNIERES